MSGIDQEFGPLIQALGAALINYVPEHFKTAYCIVEEATAHARGRLGYDIGSKEHPKDGTNRPSPDLHEAAYAIERHFRTRGTPFPRLEMKISSTDDGGWKFGMDVAYDDTRVVSDEAEDVKWQAVYSAREKLYETHIGAIPEYIQKMMNLTGVWPGGGLFQIASSKIDGACVTSSFGLSNADMPTSCTATNSSQEKSGDAYSFSATLEGRTPRWVPTELAGYGYEILLLTKTPETWAAGPIAWVVNAELLNDVDLLDRVDEMGGVTVEDLALGDGRRADFFIERATAPLPVRCQLPNGTMNLLVATRITREEMNFGIEKGRPALRERLTKAGVRQISDLDRRSTI